MVLLFMSLPPMIQFPAMKHARWDPTWRIVPLSSRSARYVQLPTVDVYECSQI